MNRDKISAKWNKITPIERNCWLAKCVMGWRRIEDNYFADGKRRIVISNDYLSFNPSEKLESAWEVVEKMKEKGMWLYLSSDWSGERWAATFRHESNHALPSEWRNTAPEAICEAALLAVMEVEK